MTTIKSSASSSHGVHLGKPCPYCGKRIDCRARACFKCHHAHKYDKPEIYDGQTNGWAAKITPRGRFRVVEFTTPRLWADVVAKARVQARRADGYVTSSLNPIYSPDFSPIVSKLPEGANDE